jgi:hypothetical protein
MYRVKYNGLGQTAPRCSWPKAGVVPKTRQPEILIVDEESIKTIIYPKELCYNEVENYDIVENMLIHIKETIPDWIEIKVDKIDNSQFL